MQPLIIIVGPTAVGKSALGIGLAKQMGGEIISGDSVQVYRHLDIGSAKPSSLEMEGIPHHLIDCLDPDEPFTAAEFQSEAQTLIREIRERGKVPIVLGGTGLYIRSLLDPYTFAQPGSAILRARLSHELEQEGSHALHARLACYDPESASRLHPNDGVRIIRALEIYELTGKTLSAQRNHEHTDYHPLPPHTLYIGLTAPRELLYERINQRCREMVDSGLVEEMVRLLEIGYEKKLKPFQSIGYRHALWQLYGLVTPQEMLRLFQRDTRHFAKRQLTWFRRDPRIEWYDMTHFSSSDLISLITRSCRA